jgi:hypothetical protein
MRLAGPAGAQHGPFEKIKIENVSAACRKCQSQLLKLAIEIKIECSRVTLLLFGSILGQGR